MFIKHGFIHSLCMTDGPAHRKILKAEPYYIWVLAPQLDTDDPNLKYYYDFDANIKEFGHAFASLGLPWQWQPVTMQHHREIIDKIADSANGHIPLVFNLCDGDEVNGAPGLSVIRYLEEKQLIYTGSKETFFHLTTSKITMKECFDKQGVATAPWKGIKGNMQETETICDYIGAPVIVKPAISGGSMGLGLKNVVHTDDELKKVTEELYKGYHGWDFSFGGFVAEKFINGPEYTLLLVGSFHQPDEVIVYQSVERVFNQKLPDEEKFLSYDRLWETYEDEKPVGEKEYENLWEYSKPGEELHAELHRLSIEAYCSVQGTGYGRVDIRMDKKTGKLYVLEVNAQCGLSEDENYTSIGAMVRLGDHSFADMLGAILAHAVQSRIKQTTIPIASRKIS